MKCPKCHHADLLPAQIKGNASPVHACPQCNGVWSESSDLSAAPGTASGQRGLPAYAHARENVICPKCNVPLFEYCYPGTEVLVDGCKRCHGLWLDKMEWALIRDSVSRKKEMTCPRCQAVQETSTSCSQCGIIIEKYLQQQSAQQEVAQALASRLDLMFADAFGYDITQNVEWLEVLTPYEVRNHYEVMVHGQRNRLGNVEEHSDSLFNVIGRLVLGHLRPAELMLTDEEGNLLVRMNKRFRLYFYQMDVADAANNPLGSIRRRFHLFRANYDVLDENGMTLLEIRGPLFYLPFIENVFRVSKDDREVGSLRKRWSGLLKEMFTDTDAFQMNMDRNLSVSEKILFFGAVFLLDFGQFENNSSRPSFNLDISR